MCITYVTHQMRMATVRAQMCSLTIECVLLPCKYQMRMAAVRAQMCSRGHLGAGGDSYASVRLPYTPGVLRNVFSYYRICSLTVECVLLL